MCVWGPGWVPWLPQCPWQRAWWGEAEAVPLGKLPSVSKAPPLRFLPPQRTHRKPSSWSLPGSGRHRFPGCGKGGQGGQGRPLQSEHMPKENWGREQQNLPATRNPFLHRKEETLICHIKRVQFHLITEDKANGRHVPQFTG